MTLFLYEKCVSKAQVTRFDSKTKLHAITRDYTALLLYLGKPLSRTNTVSPLMLAQYVVNKNLSN